MQRLKLPLILGLSHGVADGAAGLLLGGLPRTLALEQVALLVLLYNLLAFGGQPLIGLAVDRLGQPRAAALAGLLLLCGALLAGYQQPQLAVTLAGLGSAAFHVGGGALALCASPGRAAGAGLFAAPGVIGLAIGGALAAAGYTAAWPFLLPLLVLILIVGVSTGPTLPYASTTDDHLTAGEEAGAASVSRQSSEPQFESHDLVMLVLLAAIALRSAVWSSLQFVLQGRYDLLLALALAAAVGKILGGILADRVGWRRWATGALVAAAALLALGGQNLLALLSGVALLQSATPVGLAATYRLLSRQPATAAGLALGLAVAIGGLPSVGGLSSIVAAPPAVVGVLLAAALALWWALRAAGGARHRDQDLRPDTPTVQTPYAMDFYQDQH
jgi:MFS transporter, FSR family, fosmidomycin resistance protein